MDGRDRSKEKEEIEELKNRIFSGEHDDPNAEFEKVGSLVHYSMSSVYFVRLFVFRRKKKGKNNTNRNC